MMRIVFAVLAGLVAWPIVWVGTEKVFSAIWPDWYGTHQIAFTAAIKNGGRFSANTTILFMQIVCGSVFSVMSGFLAVLISREDTRSPLILGLLLLAVGVMKAVMSWRYVPVWFHVTFTALLIPMTILGGKLETALLQ